jgi:hypothetical protein
MFCKLIVLFLLNCIIKTTQVTKGRKYFPQGRTLASCIQIMVYVQHKWSVPPYDDQENLFLQEQQIHVSHQPPHSLFI